MTSITETLPTELTTAIIDSLAAPILEKKNHRGNITYDETLDDLKACSLACRHFVPLCQRYIFHTIDLETHDTTKGRVESLVGRFSNIVKASPMIGGYVQKVTVWLTPDPNEEFEDYYYPDTVASALRSLTNLKTVAITVWNEYLNLDWNDLPSSLTSEIYRLFQLPTITTIAAHHFQNFHIHNVALCLGLEVLTLEDCSLNENLSETSSTARPVRPARPMHLNIVGSSNELALLPKFVSSRLSCGHFTFNFSRLETFLMTISDVDDMRAVSDFFQHIKPPLLKTINLAFPAELDVDEIVALSLNSVIKAVKNLVICFVCDTSGANGYLVGMAAFLQTLSNDNQIQVLRICVEYLSSTSDFVDDPNWDVVNNALLTPGWSSLTKVDLEIMTFTDQENLPQAITRASMLKRLPRTRLRGLSSNRSFIFSSSLKSSVHDPRGFHYTADL